MSGKGVEMMEMMGRRRLEIVCVSRKRIGRTQAHGDDVSCCVRVDMAM